MAASTTEIAVLPAAQQELQARLNDPRTVDSLNRLLDRLDLVASSVEMLDGFLQRSPEFADNLSDGIEELRHVDTGEAMGFIGKLPQLAKAGSKMADVTNSPAFDRLLESGLLERLAEPQVLQSLTTLFSKLDLIAFGVTAIDGFLRRGDEVADSIADSFGDLRTLTSSVDTAQLSRLASELPHLVDAGNKLVASGLLDKMSDLTEAGMVLHDSGLFDPKIVKPLAEVGRRGVDGYLTALATPQKKKYGIFDLLGLLKDADLQRSLHIMVETAKNFGHSVNQK